MIKCIPFFSNDISWFDIIFSFISAILTIVLFFLGMYFEKWKERQKENNTYERFERYFVGLLNQLKRKNEQQVNLLLEAANRTDQFESKNIEVGINSNTSHKLLQELDRSILFNGFILKGNKNLNEKTITYERLTSLIDFLWYLHEYFKSMNDHLNQTFIKYWNDWKSINKSLQEIINKHFTEALSKNITNDPLLIEIFNHIKTLKKYKGEKLAVENIESAYNVYIKPLFETLQKYQNDERAALIFNTVDSLRVIYIQMKLDIDNHKINCITYSNDLKNSNITLNDLIDDFKKYSNINWSEKK